MFLRRERMFAVSDVLSVYSHEHFYYNVFLLYFSLVSHEALEHNPSVLTNNNTTQILLSSSPGHILSMTSVTTGSHLLHDFCSISDYDFRLTLRKPLNLEDSKMCSHPTAQLAID